MIEQVGGSCFDKPMILRVMAVSLPRNESIIRTKPSTVINMTATIHFCFMMFVVSSIDVDDDAHD